MLLHVFHNNFVLLSNPKKMKDDLRKYNKIWTQLLLTFESNKYFQWRLVRKQSLLLLTQSTLSSSDSRVQIYCLYIPSSFLSTNPQLQYFLIQLTIYLSLSLFLLSRKPREIFQMLLHVQSNNNLFSYIYFKLKKRTMIYAKTIRFGYN